MHIIEARRGAGVQACDCKRDRLWVRFAPEELYIVNKYLTFSFLRKKKSGV